MSAVAIAAPRAASYSRVTGFFLLATLFCVTFEKIHWSFAGTVSLADVLAILFLVSLLPVLTAAREIMTHLYHLTPTPKSRIRP